MSSIGYIITMSTIKIVNYTTRNGKEPFEEWLNELDLNTRAIIRARVNRARLGNFGNCKLLKGAKGLWEFVIDYGPGYRVYFGKKGQTIVIILVGGLKGTQRRDIEKAKIYWLDYKE